MEFWWVKRIKELEEKVKKLGEALQEAIDENGHQKYCSARRGPQDEGWLEEEKCDCWQLKAKAILKETNR